jgi:hypothetical protein
MIELVLATVCVIVLIGLLVNLFGGDDDNDEWKGLK